MRVERIRAVEKHPNADRLDLVQVNDWHCVAQRGVYKPGDLAVYLPIDSVLPPDFEAFLFPPDSKVKLHKSRVKTIKLRGAISQGMLVDLAWIDEFFASKTDKKYARMSGYAQEGMDLTADLGVTKYEPPDTNATLSVGHQQAPKKHKNPHFKEYTDLENAKHYPEVFAEGEPVCVTEKIHGTNFRAGYVPFNANTPWKRLLQLLRLAPKYEFVYGSRRVQLQNNRKARNTGFYSRFNNSDHGGEPPGNVYEEAVNKYNLRKLIPPGHVVYGEIYGDGIQKGYTYGCGKDERRLVLFDAMAYRGESREYLAPEDFENFCDERELPRVPRLYLGPYDADKAKALTKGPSVLCSAQSVREGVVVKPEVESTHPLIGRKVLKLISDEYLLRDNTEFH